MAQTTPPPQRAADGPFITGPHVDVSDQSCYSSPPRLRRGDHREFLAGHSDHRKVKEPNSPAPQFSPNWRLLTMRQMPSHDLQLSQEAAGTGTGDLHIIERKKVSILGVVSAIPPTSRKRSGAEIVDASKTNSKPPWRPRLISSPNQLLDRFVSYAAFTEEHPLQEEKLFVYDGKVVRVKLRKSRALTVAGFCSFLGVTPQTWRYWRRNRSDLSDAVELIGDAIYANKFEGAAAGLFKANIISRELGAVS